VTQRPMPSDPLNTESRPQSAFQSVAIIGLGLMGGSVALALRETGFSGQVSGWASHPSDVDGALRSGALTRGAGSVEDAVRDADLVLLAVPVRATCDLLGDVAPLMADEAVVHDIASLKVPVRAAATEAGLLGRWVGGHPMCGSEASGFPAARPELFAGARVWTVADRGARESLERIEAFWRALGAAPERTEAEPHDVLMATASHLPQIVSTLLAGAMAQAGVPRGDLGPGGRDCTRLAASNTGLWLDILAEAPPALRSALRGLGDEARGVADALEAGDLTPVRKLMERGAAWGRER